ncbi:MAG: hypothetical protein IQL11_04365 [Bacteroidales bacterium]|nr:hypothetical protein [Bacteroidales bacterium]
MKASRFSAILLFMVMLSDAASQNSQIMYYMNLPQNHLLNPALPQSNSFYLGLPGLTGINVNVNNNFLNFSDVFINRQSGDSVISFLRSDFDIDDFLKNIRELNYLDPDAQVQLFGLGFSAGENLYFFVDYNLRTDNNFTLPGDLFDIAFTEPVQLVGQQFDLSALKADVTGYQEFGFGVSRRFFNKLSVGVKGKLLMGVASASLNTKNLLWSVNSDYTSSLDADLMLNISGPVTIPIDVEHHPEDIIFDSTRFDNFRGTTRYLYGRSNIGAGIDLGVAYNVTRNLMISAAVTDLGYIKWKSDISTLEAESQFTYSGMNLLDVHDGTMTFDSLAKEFADSLMNSIIVNDTKIPFTTRLPWGFSFGASYNLTNFLSVGVLSYTRVVDSKLREALTLSANINLGNVLSFSAAYNTSNHSYNNFGAGFSVRAGVFQLYAIVDKIPVTWEKLTIKEGDDPPPYRTLSLPSNWNTIHASFGINLVFGKTSRKGMDKPMILVQ